MKDNLRKIKRAALLKIIIDILLSAVVYHLVFLILMNFELPQLSGLVDEGKYQYFFWHFLYWIPVKIIVFYIFGLYDPVNSKRVQGLITTVFIASAIVFLVIAVYYFFFNYVETVQRNMMPRRVILLYIIVDASLSTLYRIIYYYLFGRAISGKTRLAIIGISEQSKNLLTEIKEHPWLKLDIVGFITRDEQYPETFAELPVLGNVEDAPAIIKRYQIDNVIIVDDKQNWKERLIEDILQNVNAAPGIYILPRPYEIMFYTKNYYQINDIPMVGLPTEEKHPSTLIVKRAIDVIGSIFILILTSFILIITALLIKCTSKGPVFFKQERVGLNQRVYKIIKFRTMIHNAEEKTGAVFATKDDPRNTPIGGLLRKTRIDEIPQLFNVLKGDMSLVGPRPERPIFVKQFIEENPYYRERFRVKPGITGLAQVQGMYHTSPANKLKYDLTYIYNYSLWMDFRILLKTTKVVFTMGGV